MPPAARVGDMHVCPMQTPGLPPIPHVGGPISARLPSCPYRKYARSVYGRFRRLRRAAGSYHHKGSSSVLIGGRPAARIGDQMAHGGQIVMGCPTVIIGG